MDDREAIIAVFKAVGALYERLTGEKLIVTLETDDGRIRVSSDGDHLRSPAAAVRRSADLSSEHPTL